MSGIEIEYLLGLFFLCVSVSKPNNTSPVIFDTAKVLIGVVLILMAFFHKSLI